MAGEEEATCPTCSLVVRVIYDLVSAVHPSFRIHFKAPT